MWRCCLCAPAEDGKVDLVSQLHSTSEWEYPAAPDSEASSFVARLRRSNVQQSIGIRLEAFQAGMGIYISSIAEDVETAVGRYNAVAVKGHEIRAGDFIVAVGGKTDLADMKRLFESPAITLTICRPLFFEASIQRQGRPLGLGLVYDVDGASLGVKSIVPDGIGAAAGLAVGDRIVAVDGAAGGTEFLLSALRTESPTLTIARCRAA
mmetsp:Transcript_29257/g.83116  ORF Transcript_29257/g.83116 Transcript_29257/m.83116 type:complete len:208 (-) Transcript_29257:176-799(-)|eukprot:CAMPEP_0176228930 /NCGR_PEP_ID=MMETSP0121_2-20121125/23529_1 /TAXON_ID=160619 /ORGANISM="Kryptoperidinium foliaceum, Strain CCMP 1326" /LENGTH=207 /DNA_ID=CAMNT_0017568241 /DNA_START=73 /DNA_END=696 /DNA_ORIENTATION=-